MMIMILMTMIMMMAMVIATALRSPSCRVPARLRRSAKRGRIGEGAAVGSVSPRTGEP